MYLERLEIQGFKSFANPVELVFNRELTAIVGPNGSGKSSLLETLTYGLFGELCRKNRYKDEIIHKKSKLFSLQTLHSCP